MPTISELIERQRRDSGRSYREMAERAARAGLHIKFQTIANLATTPPKEWPKKTETIQALAEGLDVPERLVVLAFATSFGLDVQRDESTLGLMLPTGTRHLDEGVQRAVAAMVRSIVEAREDVGSDERSASKTRAGDDPAESASDSQVVQFPGFRGPEPEPPAQGEQPSREWLEYMLAKQEWADTEDVEHIKKQAADRDDEGE